jgi:hypothetical protein
MTHVFLGGSRAVSRLNPLIREQLENLINRRCTILIGDANGADKAMQKYFAEQNYQDVIVFCMNRFRNNLGTWQTRIVKTDRSRKDFAYFSTKDKEMAREAKCGLMLWDGESKGTLSNIIELIRAQKKVLVYLAPLKKFFKLSTEIDLEMMLSYCDSKTIENLKCQLLPELQFIKD